ncbi:MAG: L,D-transpeptidase family protein [Woeseiaceae bacterium]|nr:L,D-transpeptidase family protein [Woeseiaceae bacterium]
MKKIAFVLLTVVAFSSQSALAATYEIPADGSDIIGEVTTIEATFDDTLLDIARKNGLGYQDIVRANPGIDIWLPGEGVEVVLPTQYILPPGPRAGIVLNLAEYRLYYYPKPKAGKPAEVITHPISIGRQDWETPLGLTKVIAKATNPAWYPPQSVREEHAAEGRPLASMVPPGPDNPLGKHAMRLGLPGYLIHGTNKPAGVGMRVTHGCLRMFPENIESLFDLVAVNTPVRIINEPVKIGWHGDALVMETHPLLESAPEETIDEPLPDDELVETSAALDETPVNETSGDETSAEETPADESIASSPEIIESARKDPLTYATEQFIVATDKRPGQLDWLSVEEAAERADGIPVVVGESIKNAATSAASE